jgi:hypothetical protein
VHYDSERGGETSTRTQKSFFYVSARIIISRSFFFLVGFGVVSSRRVFDDCFFVGRRHLSAQSRRTKKKERIETLSTFYFLNSKRDPMPLLPSFDTLSYLCLDDERNTRAERERE